MSGLDTWLHITVACDAATDWLFCYALHVGSKCMSMHHVLCTQDERIACHGACGHIILEVAPGWSISSVEAAVICSSRARATSLHSHLGLFADSIVRCL
jgi:hypothetical protein